MDLLQIKRKTLKFLLEGIEFRGITRSHAVRTTVKWEVAKFDPQPTLNPLTDRHQI